MNYFGHVAVACRFLEFPEFLLGSMLPDLAGILGTGIPASTAAVQAGVQFHLLTDQVFHQLAAFRDRVNAGRAELELRGLRKGPARAVAHVATELLLDVELSHTLLYRDAYREALRVAEPGRVGSQLQWETPSSSLDFEFLRLRLLERSVCRLPFTQDRLVERLVLVVKDRPRLCLTLKERGMVRDWLETAPISFELELRKLVDRLEDDIRDRWECQATAGLQGRFGLQTPSRRGSQNSREPAQHLCSMPALDAL